MIIKTLLSFNHEDSINIRFMRRTKDVNNIVISIYSFGIIPQSFINLLKSKIVLKLFQSISLITKQADFTVINATFQNNLNNPLAEH